MYSRAHCGDNYPSDTDKKEKQSGKYIFRENDKILQLKNRPSEDVYNGDIGVLEDVDLKEKSLMVKYQDVYVFYNYDELSDISLAAFFNGIPCLTNLLTS